ncbi:MAG: UDP-N-acetylglucosamine pyrophosphorylase [Candidatus Gallimonas sp.]
MERSEIFTERLFDLSHTLLGAYLSRFAYPWEALDGLSGEIYALGERLGAEYRETAEGVWVHESAKIAPTACLCAPCIVCARAEIRHCAFIRGSVLIGADCVVGNSTELKNAVLFDGAQVPHFNYVGDSVVGYRAHLGAGAIASNVRGDGSTVRVRCGEAIETGRRKLGAMIGDGAEVGCNSVLNPGTVLGKHSVVRPLSSVRGCVPRNGVWNGRK